MPAAVDVVGYSQIALAKTAVGKGIKHGYTKGPPIPSQLHEVSSFEQKKEENPLFTFQDPHQLGMDVQSSLSELTSNFQNSLLDKEGGGEEDHPSGMLSRNSSLVDLAMLHPVEPTPVSEMKVKSEPDFMTFVDFPSQEMKPSS